jgi:hypothetical protein
MRTWMMLASLVLATTAWAGDDWYGASAADDVAPVPVAQLMANLDGHVDQALVVSGRITDVCTNRGCWAVFEDNGEMLRIMARDHSFALPAEYRGPAMAHGVLTRVEVSPEHARHLVDDDGADPAVLEQQYEYRLLTDGVRLLGES